MDTALDSVLRPRSVAVVGASPRSAMAARLTDHLRGFSGPVYPINPRHREIGGLPCYPSLAALPGPVDLVLVLVPAAGVPAVVEAAGRAGAGAVVVLSSGFAETGESGRAAQEELVALARHHGVRVLGPNCQGLIHRPTGLTATFTAAASAASPADSGIAYVGQSGALGGSFLGLARDRGVGLTAWLSVGNQADVTATEAAGALLADPHVRVLACYLEELPDGAEWAALLDRAAGTGTRVAVLRSGRSATGRRAVASHTGAMVRAGTAFDLLTARSGAVRADDLDELLDASVALTAAARPAGGRIGVVTSSGGAGGLAADHAESAGLALPALAAPTRDRLRPLIPDFGSTANPVDVTAQVINDAGQLGAVCEAVADDADVDAVLVVLTTLGGRAAVEIAESVRAAAARTGKPYAVAWLYSHEEIAPAAAALRQVGIPVVGTTAAALRLLARLLPARLLPTDSGRPAATGAPRGTAPLLAAARTEAAGGALLDALGIARPRGALVTDPATAADAARELGEHVVLKVQSADLAHKSEVGGVRVGVPAGEAAATARAMLAAVTDAAPAAALDGVLVQELLPRGVELLVSVRGAEHGYPPLVTVGWGGTATELHRDVVSALGPVDPAGATALLRRLRCWPLLAGHRGRPGHDVPAAAAAVAALSSAGQALGPGAEVEINPLVVHRGGAVAADLVASGPPGATTSGTVRRRDRDEREEAVS
ncbi:acetate--CoA ligase family protein [Saccharopolyspora cebuensis]|uniref:Acetate--CoA ligase family protein n=1 Tax=Saccharopolyspora cebuensis TaxID=418759 RepID=A0ABV4CIM6_9PSEU